MLSVGDISERFVPKLMSTPVSRKRLHLEDNTCNGCEMFVSNPIACSPFCVVMEMLLIAICTDRNDAANEID